MLYAAGLVGGAAAVGQLTDRSVIPALRDGNRNAATLGITLLVLLAVCIGRVGGVLARRYFGNMANKRYQVTLRTQLTEHYLAVDLASARSTPKGRLLAHFDADVERASEAMGPFPMSAGVVALAAVSLWSLLRIDGIIGALAGGTIPLLLVANQLFSRAVERPAAAAQEEVGRVAGVAHESFAGALVVKTLGREAAEVTRFAAAAGELRNARVRVGTLRANFEPVIDLIPNLASIAIVAVGAWRISDGDITTGQLVQAVSVLGMLTFPLRVLGYFLESLPVGVAALDRIDAALAAGVRLSEPGRSESLPVGALAVRVADVGFSYGDQCVLHDVSFSIAPGEIVALVGSTGSGKTTLCELLVRLADPSTGTVALGGQDLAGVEASERVRRVALVLQEPFLFSTRLLKMLPPMRRQTMRRGSGMRLNAPVPQSSFAHCRKACRQCWESEA